MLPDAPAAYYAHDPLVVDGVSVPWRYTLGAVHAAGLGGLACGLAWASGRWPARHLLAALLRDPGAGTRLLAEADLDATRRLSPMLRRRLVQSLIPPPA